MPLGRRFGFEFFCRARSRPPEHLERIDHVKLKPLEPTSGWSAN